MKKLMLIMSLALVVPVFQGCSTAPDARVQTVTVLKSLGASVDAGMQIAASMYKTGQITQAQWDQVADFHDNKFQPAYALAVAAAQSDLTAASPDLVNLATQLSQLILSFQKK